jgi:hypothetical protein
MSTQQKKPAATRVYPITGADDKLRHIEAPTLAQAIQFVYRPVTGRPLSGSEVAKLIREQGADAIEQVTP